MHTHGWTGNAWQKRIPHPQVDRRLHAVTSTQRASNHSQYGCKRSYAPCQVSCNTGLVNHANRFTLPMGTPMALTWGLLRRSARHFGYNRTLFHLGSVYQPDSCRLGVVVSRLGYPGHAQTLRCMSTLNSRNRPARLRVRVRRETALPTLCI